MIPYLICFTSSTWFTWLASRNKKNRILFLVFSICAIVIPCVLAGARDSSVGRDVLVYGNASFYKSARMGFMEFMLYQGKEYLFATVTYACSHVFNDIFYYYFILQALVFVPVYVTLQRDQYSNYAWIGVLSYYFIFFPYTLNLMRQSIAFAMILWGYGLAKDRKTIKFTLLVGIASMFHVTALFAILIYPIVATIEYKQNENEFNAQRSIAKSKKWMAFFLLLAGFILLNMRSLVMMMYNYDQDDYGYFYKTLTQGGNYHIYLYCALTSIFCLFYWINRKRYDQIDGEAITLFVLSAIGEILYLSAQVSTQVYRISLYFHIFLIVLIMHTLGGFSNAANKRIFKVIVVILSFVIWYIFYIKYNWNSTFPYKSVLLNF